MPGEAKLRMACLCDALQQTRSSACPRPWRLQAAAAQTLALQAPGRIRLKKALPRQLPRRLESIQKRSLFIAAQKLDFDFSFTESMPWNVGLIFRSSEIFIDNVVGGPQELRRRWRPFVCRSRLWITAVFC